MSYRDDLSAAHERIAALEAELRVAKGALHSVMKAAGYRTAVVDPGTAVRIKPAVWGADFVTRERVVYGDGGMDAFGNCRWCGKHQ